MALGQDEQVHRRLRVDVADGDEAVGRGDVVAFAVELAEETVLVHAASIPSSETARAANADELADRRRLRTSHGE